MEDIRARGKHHKGLAQVRLIQAGYMSAEHTEINWISQLWKRQIKFWN